MNHRLDEVNGRHRLTITRRFAHPIERVWRAVVEPAHLSVWYPATITRLEPVPGGGMDIDYGDGAVTTGTVLECRPPNVLEFVESAVDDMPREGDGVIRIELAAEGDGCLMTFTQIFDDRPAAPSYATGWDACLDALDDDLAGREPSTDPPSVRRYEEHVSRFGLDLPEDVGDGVHVERQLMRQPVDKVWRVLAEAEDWAPADLGGVVVRTFEPGREVVVDVASGGRAIWRVEDGPGGGRLVVDHTGTDPMVGVRYWRDHVEGLVERIIAAD